MRYQVDWYRNDLVQVGALQDFNSLSIVRTENQVGALTITIPRRFRKPTEFRPGHYLEVWREKNGVLTLFGETAYIIQDWEFYSESGEHLIAVYAKDLNCLLDTRIVFAASGTENAEMTGRADDMMKEIVTNELGSGAHSARQIPGLSVQSNVSMAPEITLEFGYQYVLDACQDIAQSATEKGTYTAFDLVRTGVGRFEFRSYTEQRGRNHSRASGDPRFVGEAYGNLENPKLGIYHGDEKNFVYAGGKGEGVERVIKQVSDSARIGVGYPYNRKELWVDARNQEDDDGVETEAYAALDENKPRMVLTGKLIDTLGMQFGRDYDFGDIVSAEAFNEIIDCHVNSVAINYSSGKGETLDVSLRGEK